MASTIDFIKCPMCGYVNCQREQNIRRGITWEVCSECGYVAKYSTICNPDREEEQNGQSNNGK